MNITIKSSRTVGGNIAAPPSKSMAHRAVLCAALAKGTSHLHHLAFSKDISATLGAAGRLCARVTTGENDAVVEGLGRFLPVDAPVDCCESGSTLRFLIPLASLTGQEVTFTGRGRLMERPQSVYKTLYQQQGLRFEQGADRLTVEGALTPGEYELAGNVSSQFISGLLFALPLLGGTSTLHLIPPVESRSYIDMTRAVQHAFGVESRWLDENTLEIPGGQHYLPGDYTVEGDYSQAAFPAVLGAVTGGVAITGLSEETLQGDAAILEILRRCGARFTRTGQGVVFEKAPLHGTDIDLADCPDLGPVLMVLGLLCEGTTVIRNAERLRIKESDRIEAMETELRACGGQLESEGGNITIHGCAGALHAPEQPLSGHNDHRVVMSLAVLALAAGLALPISGAEAIAKAPLHGTDIDLADCPDLGPVLMVLGLLCEGTTVIRNAERLRIKESDRIEAMETELRACGGQLESEGGNITIHGCAGALHAPEQPLSGHNDHRVVMSLAVLALAAGLALPISGAEAIAKSWPDFLEAIKPLGAEVEHVG